MKQGQCICPLSWSVHCNFTGDGNSSERGWACLTLTLTSQANFTLMMECTPESSHCYSVYSVVGSLFLPCFCPPTCCHQSGRKGGEVEGVFFLFRLAICRPSSKYAKCTVGLQLYEYKSFSVCVLNLQKFNTEKENY